MNTDVEGDIHSFDQLKIFTYQLQIVFFTAFMGFTILDLKLLYAFLLFQGRYKVEELQIVKSEFNSLESRYTRTMNLILVTTGTIQLVILALYVAVIVFTDHDADDYDIKDAAIMIVQG